MFFSKLIKMLRNGKPYKFPKDNDIACIKVGELKVVMARRAPFQLPHEFSVFVPRVEIRKRYYRNGFLHYEKEMIFNSLTIVHSPQRPPAGSTQTLENTAPGSKNKGSSR